VIIRNFVIVNYLVNRYRVYYRYRIFEGRLNEIVVKELSVPAAVSETFRFKSPYSIASNGLDGNGLNWEDVHIAYQELYTVTREAVDGFAKPPRL